MYSFHRIIDIWNIMNYKLQNLNISSLDFSIIQIIDFIVLYGLVQVEKGSRGY